MTNRELKSLRKDLGLTQNDLAYLIGLHPMTISKIERGIFSIPDHPFMLLYAIKDALAIDKDIGQKIMQELMATGLINALYLILKTVVEKKIQNTKAGN